MGKKVGAWVLRDKRNGARSEDKERSEMRRERSNGDVPVYTSRYGTRYVLPIDLLLTRAEMERLPTKHLRNPGKW